MGSFDTFSFKFLVHERRKVVLAILSISNHPKVIAPFDVEAAMTKNCRPRARFPNK
jgi:hypothetical protein